MKQNFLRAFLFTFIFFFALVAWGQDSDNNADKSGSNNTVQQQGPIYNSTFDSYYFSWYPVTAFPATAATWYHHPSAIVSNTLYTQAVSGTPGADIKKYALGSGNGGGVWETSTPLPVAMIGGDMVSCNGKIYYIGGDPAGMNTAGTTTVYEFDPVNNTWATKAPMPAPLTAHGAVSWGDSVIFVMGGPYSTTGSNTNVYYYRVATDSWGTITNSLPAGTGRRTFGIGISGNKILIAGGYAGVFLKNAYVGTINAANSITWTQVADIPTSYGGLSRMGGEAGNGYFFTVGGERQGGGYHDTTYVFKFANNTWLPVYIPKPTAVSNVFNAACIKTYSNDTLRMFVPSGYIGSGLTNLNFEVMKFRAATGVGIEYIINDPAFTVYPNPSNGILTLSINRNIIPIAAEIFDMRGSSMKTMTPCKGKNSLDLQDLPGGVYIIRIKTQDGVFTDKLNLLD
ncbi:MAG: T9SS type A sorting domain-containing protein [Bacteroidales bacterium]